MEYLTGFSKRKTERRIFGLAMQKVKDRKEKLERRKGDREANLEKVEDAERMKKMARGDFDDDGNDSDDGEGSEEGEKGSKSKELMFDDTTTQKTFGGAVVVTTTYGIPSDDDDEEEYANLPPNSSGCNFDAAQRHAGSVRRYMDQLRGNLPAKKRRFQGGDSGPGFKKGKHGAAGMKGMGSGADLKAAKRVLGRVEEKAERMRGKGSKSKKGRKEGKRKR